MAEEDTESRTMEVFQTRVRQLMYEYETVCSDNCDLLSRISDQEAEINDLKARIRALEEEIRTVKTSKMLSIAEGDVALSRKRIDSLVRQIDRCIALLNV